MGHREYQTHPLALILAGQQVVTVATAPLPPELHQAIPNWNDRDLHSKPEEFALHVMWCVLSGYVTAMNRINAEVDELQRELGNAPRNKQLYQIMAMQKSLIYFESVLNNTMPILKDLRKGERFFTTASYDRALQNVMVEAHQASTMAGVTERVLEQYNTTVSSIVSNNLNIIMKVLTSITIILTIPTVIGGLWGMNVPVPFAHQYWAFWGIIAATALLCGISSYILWKHDYF
ncbi:magnesium transporter CorA family protein [Lacticaseibacillus zhaodongensis]|uniref:magnesium transporter CorA family protein n=1 Tax=Lacticaseibacillus zhaodongensis TaxID=2668065 RepID=UPI0012D2E046|nr:magnesium transporter CorA family protein [Lacticaseibacillus zhaodongensis]